MSLAILPELRTCNTCNVAQPLINFHKNIKCKNGILPRCKSCRKIADAPYVQAHSEKNRINARKWREINTERADKRAREWALKHPEKIKANRDRFRSTEHGKLSDQSNVRNRRARQRGAEGRHTPKDIAALLKIQRMKCANCTTTLKYGHHVDHIMPLALGGSNEKSNLQILCPTCNMRKSKKHPIDFAQENGRLL
jgi:hypothetical protein